MGLFDMLSAKRFLLLLLILSLPFPALPVVDIYEFDTESQRERYNVLVDELRCPKCQNQNLSGSNSQIASDLRRELHRLLLEGKTDREIKDFMVARYGDFVLYRPRLQGSTLMLWLFPLLLLAGGAIALIMIIRQRRQTNAAVNDQTLSDTEKSTLNQILDESEKSSSQ